MENVKKVVLKKYIDDVLYDLYVKTHADIVIVDNEGTTLAAKITELISSIATKASKNDIDTAINKLVNGAPETYDTLKEIANYIEEHEDIVTALNSAIGNKVDKEEGKGLSEKNFTTALYNKLNKLKENYTTDDITETETKKYVTQAEKDKISKSAKIIISSEQADDLTDNDLWCQDIS